jgi:hypothetical protein
MRRRVLVAMAASLAGRRSARIVASLPLIAASGMRPARGAGEPLGGIGADPERPNGFELAYDGFLETGGRSTPLATALLRLVAGDGDYRMTLDVDSLIAKLHYESRGRVADDGLHPERYRERRRMPFGRRRDRSVRFVPADASSGPKAAGETYASAAPAPGENTLAVPAGTQDRLSLVGQLWRLARDEDGPIAAGRPIEIALASTSKVRRVVLRADPAAGLDVGGRAMRAHRIRRVDGSEQTDDLDVEVWLDAANRHLPLAIRFIEPDRALRFVAKAARG